MITPNQMMCKPIIQTVETSGWKHICKADIGGIAIINRIWINGMNPSTFVINYNISGRIGVILVSKNGDSDNTINKFRVSSDSNGTYLDYYYTTDQKNVIKAIVMDVSNISVDNIEIDADGCETIGMIANV